MKRNNLLQSFRKHDSSQGLLRETLKYWGPSLVLLFLGFWISLKFVKPAPPRSIRMATGIAEGAYQEVATRYRDILTGYGIDLELVSTQGALENLELLNSGAVDLGFVQGGLASQGDYPKVEALASVFKEPLWIFCHEKLQAEDIGSFKGLRIAVGPEGSGTRPVAMALLNINGVNAENSEILPLAGRSAVRGLREGTIDVAFAIISPRAPVVREFLELEGITVMPLDRYETYCRLFSYLSATKITEGLIDLDADLPPRSIMLIAPTAVLATNSSLHPALIPLLLEVAEKVHGGGGLLEEAGQFPSSLYLDLPQNESARRYLKDGPSFLAKWLPFWVANLLDRFMIMLVPLLTLFIPVVKMTPPVIRWQIRRRIYRWYKILRSVDQHLYEDSGLEQIEDDIAVLRRMEAEVAEVSVPLSYMEEFYHMRTHIAFIMDRLVEQRDRMEQSD
jgi:hypothetical protein